VEVELMAEQEPALTPLHNMVETTVLVPDPKARPAILIIAPVRFMFVLD
jgi:hypothetical protein